MKIKELTISAKQSYNFNTYEASVVVELEEPENLIDTTRLIQKQLRDLVEQEIEIDKNRLKVK